jgi:hypothetical protein
MEHQAGRKSPITSGGYNALVLKSSSAASLLLKIGPSIRCSGFYRNVGFLTASQLFFEDCLILNSFDAPSFGTVAANI